MCCDLIYFFLSASLPSISFGFPIGPPLTFLCLFLCLCDLMNLVAVDYMDVWVAGAFFPELWTFALYHRRSLTLPQPPPPAAGVSRRGGVSGVPPCSIADVRLCYASLVQIIPAVRLCEFMCAGAMPRRQHSTTPHPFLLYSFVKFICFYMRSCSVNV